MKMNRNTPWMVAMIAILLLLPACSAAAPAAPTQDPVAIYTMAAATVQAQLTSVAASQPTQAPTEAPTATTAPSPTVEIPTLAPVAQQPTLAGLPAQPASGFPTPLAQLPSMPTVTPGFGIGDKALFQYQVPVDGFIIAPSEQFHIAWGVKNVGGNVWTTDYKWVFLGGQQLSGVTVVPLEKAVNPGEKTELFVAATAPGTAGKYTTHWKLVNQIGVLVAEVYLAFTVSAS
jgi:hypothetical protein